VVAGQVPLLRRDFWHTSMHTWCTRQGREAVLAVLITELRVDERADAAVSHVFDRKFSITFAVCIVV